MKKRKWIRLLCSIITAGSMLMGTTAFAVTDLFTDYFQLDYHEIDELDEIGRNEVHHFSSSYPLEDPGYLDKINYIPFGEKIQLSKNPDFTGTTYFKISCFIMDENHDKIIAGIRPDWEVPEVTTTPIAIDFAANDWYGKKEYYFIYDFDSSFGDLAGMHYDGEIDHATLDAVLQQYSADDFIYVLYCYASFGQNNPWWSIAFRYSDESAAQNAVATPTASKVVVDGETIAFDAYLIDGNNYFKLRDVAQVLSGSDKQFEVTWDGAKNAINLISGQSYTSVGGELAAGSGANQTATPTSSTIYLNGKQINLTAYTIQGNNYFKLRDLGQTFDFGVGWDGANNTVTIDTSTGYTPE